jgi:hypothetical protein
MSRSDFKALLNEQKCKVGRNGGPGGYFYPDPWYEFAVGENRPNECLWQPHDHCMWDANHKQPQVRFARLFALSAFDTLGLASSFSMRTAARLGSAFSVSCQTKIGNLFDGNSLSLLDFYHMGSSLSLEVEPYRGFARCILAIFQKYRIFAQFFVIPFKPHCEGDGNP